MLCKPNPNISLNQLSKIFLVLSNNNAGKINGEINTKIINTTELFAVNIDDDFKLFIYYILFVLYNIIYKNYYKIS